ncbi:heavy metal-associated domain-containing protein [Aneurinibacillus sp. Ricciae_BoGa-3]|uniref:heavy-metal-associated domain-containing protein n=1 Tax=Aneurinibacillus sp. Ricciae_BoGa-3 TaxID=3022697 RepID=UPI002340B938|nr:heavy metal-associated domain-containing protein [Aneurinibacillus sp. Ricciae_BoGa-3]WCK52974.1 heavy metal-associated domain-containing protein [Aneurinibacillus sp. Ricciae_BoGa-3]
MSTATIKVKGMTCQACVNSVTKSLQGVEGVQKADVDLAKHQATVTYDEGKTSPSDLKKAVEDAGFEAE